MDNLAVLLSAVNELSPTTWGDHISLEVVEQERLMNALGSNDLQTYWAHAELLEERGMVRRGQSASNLDLRATLRGLAWGRHRATLARLRETYDSLVSSPNRQRAGWALEAILNGLFRETGLDPRASFRTAGAQIDGSFVLDNRVHIVEAKWMKGKMGPRSLLSFQAGVSATSAFTLGVFVSISGYTANAVDSLGRGAMRNVMLMNGHDLEAVLNSKVELGVLLRAKFRRLVEEGRPLYTATELAYDTGSD